MIVLCHACGSAIEKAVSAINRAAGGPMFCNKVCFGISRRLANPPTVAERKEAKRLYDEKRRAEKRDEINAKKLAHYYANREQIKVKQTAYRAKHMARHVAYCQRPEYKEWKSEYDRRHRAKKQFGEFAESALLLQDVEKQIDQLATRYEIYQANETLNKAQTRRRSL
jgi:hypothetical protein